MRPARTTLLAALPAVLALCLSACGDGSSSGSPSGSSSGAAAPKPAEKVWTVSHILVGMKNPRLPKVERTEAQAQALAKSLTNDIANGRSFDELLDKFTDDRDKEGKPNTNNGKPGSYDFSERDLPSLAPEFAAAIKELPVGKVTPEPVRTMFGYHVIRRDK